MSLQFAFQAAYTIGYSSSAGLLKGAGSGGQSVNIALTDGTAAGPAAGTYSLAMLFPASGPVSLLLAYGLEDLYGNELQFSALKALILKADPTNVGAITLGGGSWQGFFGDPSNTVIAQPGDTFPFLTTSANGWPVDPAADQLLIVGTPGDHVQLALVGVSSTVSPPVWAVEPQITATPAVGTALTPTAGSVSGSPLLSYQWRRNGRNIAGATAASYTPTSADAGYSLSRVTIATNSAGQVNVTTKPKVVPGGTATVAAPANSTAPTVTGTAQVGQTLTSSTGSWSGSPTAYAYQWYRGSTAISGATSAAYTCAQADVGSALFCAVTATNGGGSTTANSAATSNVLALAPTNTTAPAISGTAQVGQTLTCSQGTWSNAPTSYAYQWMRNGVAISGATASTYTPVAADVGNPLTCTVTATNSGGTASVTSAATANVIAASQSSNDLALDSGSTSTSAVT